MPSSKKESVKGSSGTETGIWNVFPICSISRSTCSKGSRMMGLEIRAAGGRIK